MSVFTNPAAGAPGQAAEYTAAILELLGDREPLDVLRATADALRAAVEGMTDEQLSRPERPGKWSVRQVVRHLADTEIVWGWRLRLALSQDRPALTGFDQDAWADRLDYASADVPEAIEEFTVLRRTHLRILDGATPADFQRVGVHVERGDESVAHMTRMYAGHDLLHLVQIGRIRAG